MAADRPTDDVAPLARPTPSFSALGLPDALVDALAREGITTPFPIQVATLPDALAGRDLLGRGRTGSGKTLGFVLPLLGRLVAAPRPRRSGRPRALVLAPTRELATQIDATLAPLAAAVGLRSTVVFGGVGQQPQVQAIRNGIDVVVACPGRLEDLVQQRHVHLDAIEITVLDEADHMADMGFLPVVRRLLERTPADGQRLLFSATLDDAVAGLVRRFLPDPVTHSVDPEVAAVPEMDHHVLHVSAADRFTVLVELTGAPGRSIVFTRTKHRAKALAKQLVAAGVPAVEMHGNLAQTVRTRNMAAFADGGATTLVATDIAARGIHVDDVELVVHADPPVEHKAYLHRSGRTARAGNAGTVITIMTDDQQAVVRDLVRKAGIKPTTTRVAPGHRLLGELAPGERVPMAPRVAAPAPQQQPQGAPRGEGRPGGARRNGRGRAGAPGRPGGVEGGAGGTRRGGRPAGGHTGGTGTGSGATAGGGRPGGPRSGGGAAAGRPGAPRRSGGPRPR